MRFQWQLLENVGEPLKADRDRDWNHDPSSEGETGDWDGAALLKQEEYPSVACRLQQSDALDYSSLSRRRDGEDKGGLQFTVIHGTRWPSGDRRPAKATGMLWPHCYGGRCTSAWRNRVRRRAQGSLLRRPKPLSPGIVLVAGRRYGTVGGRNVKPPGSLHL